MKKTIAAFVSAVFLFGTTGFALAQTPAPAPPERKADDKAMDKKPAKKMTMEERKAACMEKAGTDDAKKGACEKRYTAKSQKMDKKMDKMETKKDAAPEKK